MLTEVEGYIEFEPEIVTKKHEAQAEWKHVAMIRTRCDLESYYRWFLEKRFSLDLNRTLRGAHVTFISDRMNHARFMEGKRMFDGQKILFYLEQEPRTNGNHWWLRAHSPMAEEIREEMGLSPEPHFTFHMTLGHAKENRKEESQYIYRQCQRFGLLSSEPRRPMYTHEIWRPR